MRKMTGIVPEFGGCPTYEVRHSASIDIPCNAFVVTFCSRSYIQEFIIPAARSDSHAIQLMKQQLESLISFTETIATREHLESKDYVDDSQVDRLLAERRRNHERRDELSELIEEENRSLQIAVIGSDTKKVATHLTTIGQYEEEFEALRTAKLPEIAYEQYRPIDRALKWPKKLLRMINDDQCHAKRLDPLRAYPVAYFDDERTSMESLPGYVRLHPNTGLVKRINE